MHDRNFLTLHATDGGRLVISAVAPNLVRFTTLTGRVNTGNLAQDFSAAEIDRLIETLQVLQRQCAHSGRLFDG